MIALWALVLSLQNVIRLMYTLTKGFTYPGSNGPLTQLYLYQWVTVAFSLAFLGAAVGLWRREKWGRLLFLVTALLFFVVAIMGLVTTQTNTLSPVAKIALGMRYGLSIVLPWWYLSLSFVKNTFTNTKIAEE